MAKKIIKARIKQRTDTQANWAANNPVLLDGELGFVTDDKNLYKVGDGVTAWNDLPFRGFDGTLVHTTGDSETAAMSQKGVTEKLTELGQEVAMNQKGVTEKLAELGQEVGQKANKTDITTPDWNITTPSENGYILNRTHGIDARLKTAKGTLTELLGGVFSQYVPVIHYDNGELLIRHLYLNGAVIEPEVGKEYQVLYSGASVFAKIEEDGVGGYDILLKGGSDTGAIVEISVVIIKKLDSPYIPDEIARTEQVDEVREETLAIWEHLDDGYAPNFAVGVADQLAGQDEPTPSEINFRKSGGGAILDGNARIEAIKGNSVVWNQLSTTTELNESKTTESLPIGASIVQGHKYAIIYESSNARLYFYTKIDGSNKAITSSQDGKSWIFTSDYSATSAGNINTGLWWFLLYLNSGITAYSAKNIRLIDLTKAFPNDWQNINTIEDFYRLLPPNVDINEYNEGEVIHMDVQSIESVGVNQWDEEWRRGYYENGEFIAYKEIIANVNLLQVIPNETYYYSAPQGVTMQVCYYDNEENYIGEGSVLSNTTFTIPANVSYINFRLGSNYGATYNNDICINLSDASIDGKYFHYVKRMQSLDIIRKYFPDGMKSAGTAHDEIRYNKTTQKWEYSKGKIKSVDLGTLNWLYVESEGMLYALDDRFYVGQKLICSRYIDRPGYDIDGNMYAVKGILRIFDSSYTDASTFKAAMSGVMLYYESNDWEWVELDKEDQLRNFDYQVWNCGTEKAIANVPSTPLKADIVYGFNAYGTIKQLKEQMATLMTQMAQMQTAMASNIVE